MRGQPESQTRRRVLWSAALAMLCVCAILPAVKGLARDREFEAIVHQIEVNYHAHRTQRFLMGCVGLVVRITHPQGVNTLKIALFEDRFPVAVDDIGIEYVMRKALDAGWHSMVRVSSRRSGEHTYVYARDQGRPNQMELLILTIEPGEAVVLQVQLNSDRLTGIIDNPGSLAKSVTSGSQ